MKYKQLINADELRPDDVVNLGDALATVENLDRWNQNFNLQVIKMVKLSLRLHSPMGFLLILSVPVSFPMVLVEEAKAHTKK